MVGLAQIEGKHVANKVVILPTEDGSSIGAALLSFCSKGVCSAPIAVCWYVARSADQGSF